MSFQQNEFRGRFTCQAPILPESVDDATAFFHAFNQLIRLTPSEISEMPASSKPGFAARLLDCLGSRLRGIVVMAVGCIRRADVTALSTWKG